MILDIEQAFDSKPRRPRLDGRCRQEGFPLQAAQDRQQVAYPEKWRDYTRLSIGRQFAPRERLERGAVETARDLAKIGKPVDRENGG